MFSCDSDGMDEEQRRQLGDRIQSQRIAVFGTVTAAVRAAMVNPETWARAERGDSIRADRMAAIVRALWPHTMGRVELIDQEVLIDEPHIPVGAGIDPELLAELATASPDQVQRVKDFMRGIKSGE
jgi:hypothetical protein